ncbi:hypothetical protein BpHYR1_015263 [Brachionus plicatilis]|uniref:Uncharacterized protein n=1 Tax=Brachionus plicatilis TaxID=10195 RepID=A0A3M7Q4C1_BRAPC|nr:hypothetical protein BpHYR1_015263 [Brachionus plicatilis]
MNSGPKLFQCFLNINLVLMLIKEYNSVRIAALINKVHISQNLHPKKVQKIYFLKVQIKFKCNDAILCIGKSKFLNSKLKLSSDSSSFST